MNKIICKIWSYDEEFATFKIGQTSENTDATDIDFDDFTVPAPVVASMLGVRG